MAKNFLRNHLKAEFAQIPNALIEDRTLSATARALFCYLAVKPDNWEFFMPDIADGLRISQDTLRKVIKELENAGWIEDGGQDRKSGQFGSKIISIFAFKTPKTGDDRVGNLPIRQKTESVKNRIGKNPTHNNTHPKKYSTLKNTHSSSNPPPIEDDEEEGVISSEIVPSVSLPPQLSHLTEDVVFDWAKAAAEKPGVNNPARYRAALLKKVRESDPETLENVLIFAESGGQKPANKASARQIGQIAGEIAARIEIMRNHNRSQFEIDKEVEGIIRHAISIHQLSQIDIAKIQNDVDILLGGAA
jgi:hypothetical protein